MSNIPEKESSVTPSLHRLTFFLRFPPLHSTPPAPLVDHRLVDGQGFSANVVRPVYPSPPQVPGLLPCMQGVILLAHAPSINNVVMRFNDRLQNRIHESIFLWALENGNQVLFS